MSVNDGREALSVFLAVDGSVPTTKRFDRFRVITRGGDDDNGVNFFSKTQVVDRAGSNRQGKSRLAGCAGAEHEATKSSASWAFFKLVASGFAANNRDIQGMSTFYWCSVSPLRDSLRSLSVPAQPLYRSARGNLGRLNAFTWKVRDCSRSFRSAHTISSIKIHCS